MDRSRKVMQLANTEATALRHEYIGTEHILLGLVKEGSGVAANVLLNFGISLDRVRAEIAKVGVAVVEEPIVMGRLPHTPRAKKLIEYAIQEAKALKDNYVGTEHLLLGLLQEEETLAAKIIITCGPSLADVRAEVLRLLDKPLVSDQLVAIPASELAAIRDTLAAAVLLIDGFLTSRRMWTTSVALTPEASPDAAPEAR